MVTEEQAPGEEAEQAHQDQYGRPHGGAQDRVVVGMGNEVLDGGNAQGLVFGVERALAQVEIANLHAGSPDSGW
ncbi:hypothetical protein D3C80_1902050 [compost metagenome]